MKNRFLLLFLFAYTFNVAAQDDCSGYFPFEEGQYFTMNSYNKKGKLSSTTHHEVQFLMDDEVGVTEATIDMVIMDEKGEEVNKSSYSVTCLDGVLNLDIQSMMIGLQDYYTEGIEVTVETSGLVMPSELKVGDQLEDAYTSIQIGNQGIVIMTSEVKVTDRKVVSSETITTPAGTFDCMKIESTMSSKALMANFEYQMVDWFAFGKGLIRSETYRKGKLDSYTEMTAIGKK